MSLFQWNERFSVGVSAMDTQHKRLVELINRIYDAMRDGKGDAIAGQILDDLVVYVRVHFTAEEALLHEAGYPHLAAHQATHRAFTEKANTMVSDLKSGKKVATVSLATFLKDWLVEHIQKEDRQYGQFMASQQPALR